MNKDNQWHICVLFVYVLLAIFLSYAHNTNNSAAKIQFGWLEWTQFFVH